MNKGFHEIFNTNPRLSTSISFILGLLLVDNLTAPEQNMLGNWIILLGQTILTNASSQNIIEGRIKGGIININSKEVKSIYNPPVYNIETIKKIIKQVYPDHSIDLEALTNIIEELQSKIEEIKKD